MENLIEINKKMQEIKAFIEKHFDEIESNWNSLEKSIADILKIYEKKDNYNEITKYFSPNGIDYFKAIYWRAIEKNKSILTISQHIFNIFCVIKERKKMKNF